MSQHKLALLLFVALVLGVSNHVLITQYFKYREEQAQVEGYEAISDMRYKQYYRKKKREREQIRAGQATDVPKEIPEVIQQVE